MTDLERGGYFVGPSEYAKHLGICAIKVDLNDAREVYSAEDAVAVALVSIQVMLRSLDADGIVKTAELVTEFGGMPHNAREVLRDLLNYMDEHDEIQAL